MPGDEPNIEADIRTRLHRALSESHQDELRRIEAAVDRLDAERLSRLTAPDALATAALWYAANGMPVFPLRPGGKQPLTIHGFKDATTDLAVVRDWWARSPQANIGLPTGALYDVIDVDPPAGFESLQRMREAAIVPRVAGYAHTPRGGMHLYIAPTGDGNATNVAGLPGIDYRGVGGYVVAPPSRTDTGMWIWSTPIDPTEIAT